MFYFSDNLIDEMLNLDSHLQLLLFPLYLHACRNTPQAIILSYQAGKNLNEIPL